MITEIVTIDDSEPTWIKLLENQILQVKQILKVNKHRIIQEK